jgi:hypothetical protein
MTQQTHLAARPLPVAQHCRFPFHMATHPALRPPTGVSRIPDPLTGVTSDNNDSHLDELRHKLRAFEAAADPGDEEQQQARGAHARGQGGAKHGRVCVCVGRCACVGQPAAGGEARGRGSRGALQQSFWGVTPPVCGSHARLAVPHRCYVS